MIISSEGGGRAARLGTLVNGGKARAPERRFWARWPQGQGLCQMWAVGVEMGGG